MGVPAFFRWLTVRFPKVVVDALTDDELEIFEEEFKKQTTGQDANEIDLGDEVEEAMQMATKLKENQAKRERVKEHNPTIDNLYLDMNGIIHPCSHP